MRPVVVTIAADKEFRLGAIAQKLIRIEASFGLYRCPNRDQRFDIRIRTNRAQSGCRAKGKSSENNRQREFMLQPGQRSLHIGDFSSAFIMAARAQPGSAKIKAQHGKAERVQRLHRMKDDLVVHGAAAQRMRMADQSSIFGVWLAGVQQGFQASGWPVKEKRSNGCLRMAQRIVLVPGERRMYRRRNAGVEKKKL